MLISYLALVNNRRRAEKKRRETRIDKIENPDSVSQLRIIPLVDYYGSNPQAKTEAGVSYLIKADGFSLLMDVGYNEKKEHPSPLLSNMELLGERLEDLDALFISHAHLDHLGGMEDQRKKTFSLSKGFVNFPAIPVYTPVPLRPSRFNENPASTVHVIEKPTKLAPGVFSIGSIPRALYLMGYVEEQALAVNVAGKGVVLIIGCGHQTIQRVLERAQALFDVPIYGIVGGLHFPVHGGRIPLGPINLQALVGSDRMPWKGLNEQDVYNAIQSLREAGVRMVSLSAHDSSDWALNRFREAFGPAYYELAVGTPLSVDAD